MKVTIYGIPNCGSVKKARTFFEEKGIAYHFHDFKKAGISKQQLQKWSQEFGWEKVLNRKGLTWRNLDDALKQEIVNEEAAINLMLKNSSAIKRPVIETDKGNTIGFDQQEYEGLFL